MRRLRPGFVWLLVCTVLLSVGLVRPAQATHRPTHPPLPSLSRFRTRTLPADRLRAADAQDSVTLTTGYGRTGVVQNEAYAFESSAGPMTVTLSGIPDNGYVNFVVMDRAQDNYIFDKWFYEDATFEVNLPAAGEYYLFLAPNRVNQVTVSVPGLIMSTEMPLLRVPSMPVYETKNDPFAVHLSLDNPEDAGYLVAYLGNELIYDDDDVSDGQILPITVDTGALADGLYQLYFEAGGKTSVNAGYSFRHFHVDRVDSFPDVPATHWARRPIEIMYHLGIIAGRPDGNFAPGQPVRRDEFAKLIAETLDLEPSESDLSYVDVPEGQWAYSYIAAVTEAGLMQGTMIGGQPHFMPDRFISRAEAATIVGRALGIPDEPVNPEPPPYPDFATIPAWAQPFVLGLAEYGWMNGYPDGSFHPLDRFNRDQAAKLLGKFYGI